jgi:hypothetical protein
MNSFQTHGVIPAKAGISVSRFRRTIANRDSRFRGNDPVADGDTLHSEA